ncbi:MAG: hypothetical protein FWD69_07370 [Polyangiaceae bacterium]|nr:hypothetical protein [Polyangiaceae bacterium]
MPTARWNAPRLTRLVVLAIGLAATVWIGSRTPREQHVRVVLGSAASDVTDMELQYVDLEGDLVRDARMHFEPGRVPRVVTHEPSLANGDYQLRIELGMRDARRSTERRVTLSGGTTSVDVTSVLGAP